MEQGYSSLQLTATLKTSITKNFSKFILGIIILLGVLPKVAEAQFTSAPNETLVNTTTVGEQWAYFWSVRTVAVQPDGGYVNVWIDNGGLDGSGQGIFGQRFSASGGKLGGQFQVNTTTSGDQTSPSIAVAPDGSFLVGWEGPGTSQDVFGQFFTKTGVKKGTEFLLSTSVIGNQSKVEVQYYPDGTFVSAFVDGAQSILQRFDAEGRNIGLETKISSPAGAVVLDALSVRPDNTVLLTWTAGGDVYGQSFSSTLAPIATPTRLNTFTAGTQQYCINRVDREGNFVVVWESDGQDGSGNGIYGRRYDKSFNALSGEFAITTNTAGDQFEPQLAVEPGGRFVVTWSDNNNRDGGGVSSLLSGLGASVWMREYAANGGPVGVETQVNQSILGYQAYPVIDVNASGKFVIMWEGNGTQLGNIDTYGVFTRAYQLSQTGTTSISVSPTSGVASDIVTVTMTLTNPPTSITNVKPNPLSVSGTNDVFASLLSGPSPASATVGTSPVSFTWIYRLTANGSAGALTFGGNASGSGGAIFPYATSNTITVKPALYLSDITAPNLVGDANIQSQPDQGPSVFTIGAKITNAGLTPLTEVKIYLGDGVIPGVFPVTTMTLAQTNNTYQGSFALIPLGGAADCSRSLISLAPSKSIIAGKIDFNGDGSVNSLDFGVLGNGKTVIGGLVDADQSGTITTADNIPAPPGVYTGYREPPIINGSVDVNRDGKIDGLDAGTYGGEIKNVYWQVSYKVLDASGKATFGNTQDFNDDLRYRWSIWSSAKDGGVTRADTVNDYAKVRSEISALANKITPNPNGYISGGPARVIAGQVDVNSDGIINSSDNGFYYGKPVIGGKIDMNGSTTITSADNGLLIGFTVIGGFIDVNNSGTISAADDGLLVQQGQTFSITVHNADFGTIGAGFDENRDNLFDYDFWYQPIGEANWPSGSFRLVDIQADITGTGGSNPLNNKTTHFNNEPYLSRLFNDQNNEGGGFTGTYTYTFQALTPANGVLSPYQEAASGTNNEKYNGDYGVGIGIFVQPVAPSTNPDFNSTLVNVAVPGNVSTNDAVPAGTTYGTPTLVSSPAGSTPTTTTITLNSNGTYSFTTSIPGVYTYNVPVCVPGQPSPCPTTKLVITVLNANVITNAPVANVDIATTNFNTAVTLQTLSNDAAGNLNNSLVPSSVVVTVAPLNGTTLVDATTGNITYKPNVGFTGVDTLTYQVCDNQVPVKCATALQIITVKPSGSALNTTTAADDYKITSINTVATGNVKTNDSDAEGNIQTVTAQTTPIAGKGTLVLAADGSYTFTPVTGFTGSVDFIYTTCDDDSPQACATATLHILVTPQVAPFTNPDFNTTFVNVAVPGNVSTNDVVPAGTTYGTTPTLLSSPVGSAATLTMNSNGTYSFTANTPGVYTYDVQVCVPGQLAPCPTTRLVITVLNANITTNAPVANVDIATTNLNTLVILRTLANDAAGNATTALVPSSVTVTSQPTRGTATVNATTGDITYIPNAGFSGRDTLTYQVCNNQTPAKCATAIQIITVNPAGTPNTTTAADDYKITSINTAAIGNVKTNDSDAEGNIQTVTAQTTTIAGKGTLVLNADGSYTFTPVTGFTGPVDFVYVTCDNGTPSACATATLHILVQPAPSPDLTPKINLVPNNIIGLSVMEITVEVNELNNVITNGSLITLFVDKQNLFSNFTFNASSILNLAGEPIQNSLFNIDAVSNPDFYVITTNALFVNSLRRLSFSVLVNPGQTKGTTPLNVYLKNASGGETNFTNNSSFTVFTFSF